MGRPEIFLEGAWQQICAAGFDRAEADIACRQLGYGTGTVGPFFAVPHDDPEAEHFADVGVTLPRCYGTEGSLLKCGRNELLQEGLPPFILSGTSNLGCRNSQFPGDDRVRRSRGRRCVAACRDTTGCGLHAAQAMLTATHRCGRLLFSAGSLSCYR